MGEKLVVSILKAETSYYDSKFRKNIPPTLLGFLRSLDGLTVIDVEGNDTSKWRVVTTLIHGNEPSGLIASHLWLKSHEIPETNVRIVICNPEAAKTKPFFTNRFVEHSDDLNRFFSYKDEPSPPVAIRAHAILKLVREVRPEGIIDMHNTSGASPAFSVAVSADKPFLKLAELFADSLILTQLNVGAIMEQSFEAPIVTIECGGANDNSSHQVASNGLHSFFHLKNLFDDRKPNIKVRKHPIRVELTADASVGFSHHRLTTTDITLRADIEELNKGVTPAGEFIGWCEPDDSLQLEAIDENGKNRIDSIIEKRNNCLFTKSEMHLFMVTTVPEIATKDCLFYTTLLST